MGVVVPTVAAVLAAEAASRLVRQGSRLVVADKGSLVVAEERRSPGLGSRCKRERIKTPQEQLFD